MMNINAFKSKITRRKRGIIRSIGFFILFRSIYGIAILVLAYVLGVEIEELRQIQIFGFHIYILVVTGVIIIILRRFYKIYKWWNTDD